jgi:phosphoribosylformylglycinamidine cyclo-ligase
VLVGIQSSGIHSNGFSAGEKALRDGCMLKTKRYGDMVLGDMLLEPTRIYVKPILEIIKGGGCKGNSA